MRLWPLEILRHLPRQQLLGQHRECCALRGKGWGRKHSTVDYVFRHPHEWLYMYHIQVMLEMRIRGYRIEPSWYEFIYRGKELGFDTRLIGKDHVDNIVSSGELKQIYPEHDLSYVRECILNLRRKGVDIMVDKDLQMRIQRMGMEI